MHDNRLHWIGALLTIALLGLSGPVAAGHAEVTSDAYGQGEAALEGRAWAYANASGAVEELEQRIHETRAEAHAGYNATVDTYTETKAQARERFNQTHGPDANVSGEIEGHARSVDEVRAEHEDRASESVEAETEYVEAGGGVDLWGHVSAYLEGAVEGIVHLVDDGEDRAPSEGELKGEANQKLDAASRIEAQARGQLDAALGSDVDAPDLSPSASVDEQVSSTTSTSTETLSSASGGVCQGC